MSQIGDRGISTVARWRGRRDMARSRNPARAIRSRGTRWSSHIRGPAEFVPTIGFDLLYAYIIVRLDRRELVWISVTTNPTAEWVARQVTEAFPWNDAPRYMIRDRDRIYGAVLTRRLRAMGNPGQAYRVSLALAEWCCRTADRVGPARVFGPHHCPGRGASASDSAIVCLLLQRFRTHRSLNKDAPISRPVQRTGVINSRAILGGTPSPLRPSLGFRYTHRRSSDRAGEQVYPRYQSQDRQSAWHYRAFHLAGTCRRLPVLARRIISLRRGIWSLPRA